MQRILKEVHKDVHKELYYMFSRIKFFESEQKKGYIKLKIKDTKKFLQDLKLVENDESFSDDEDNFTKNIDYITVSNNDKNLKRALKTYDPNTQFILNIIVNDPSKEETEDAILIVNTSLKRDIFYGNLPANDVAEFMDKTYDVPCLVCKDEGKFLLYDIGLIKIPCKCCDKICKPKAIMECYFCCSQYMYF